MKLREPFETSTGVWSDRRILLVSLHSEGIAGWGECVAAERPDYSYETTDTAWSILTGLVLPRLSGITMGTATDITPVFDGIRGHPMAKAAVEMAVNVIERVLEESPREDARPYLHHVSVMPPEATLQKMADLDIIVASQPAFMYWLGPFAVEALEGEREQTNNPQKTLLKRGIRMSYGTDGAPTDPRVELWSAVMREGWDGKVYGPGERVSLEEAIRAITMGTAYMNFDEKKKGSLEVGKLADMVVLGRDILTIDPNEIRDIPIEMTVIGGKVVYSAQ